MAYYFEKFKEFTQIIFVDVLSNTKTKIRWNFPTAERMHGVAKMKQQCDDVISAFLSVAGILHRVMFCIPETGTNCTPM